jgi:hypothetical protein
MKKVTLAEFEETLPVHIRREVFAVKKPYPAGKIAMVNHEDNFIHYFASIAFDAVLEEFMLLDEHKAVSDELYDWFNKLGNMPAYRVPIVIETLKKIYAELR